MCPWRLIRVHRICCSGPAPDRNCSDTPWGKCWTGCPVPGAYGGPPWSCAGGNTPPPLDSDPAQNPVGGGGSSCNACVCNARNTSCGHEGGGAAADARGLSSATAHLDWAQRDPRVIGLFVYRLKNLWQKTSMAELDACQNPWGTGLGLVDRCGLGGTGDYAMPETLEFYQQNVSRVLASPPFPVFE